ncbi:MAG: ABC transporter substrate-binding protein, partial [Anaerolineae bacterium]|nr:ABC transporter substrate-binding protein [Anaerolineae bacterium]
MKLRYWTLLLILVIGSSFSAASAQEAVTVSLVIPPYFEDLITDEMIQRFEADNPGIKVHVKPSEQLGFAASPAYSIEDYLDAAKTYASSGDVIFLSENSIFPEATRAGYVLDLKPHVQADMSFNTADFYPAAWDSYQWDNGLWAIPVSLDIVVLAYDQAAFDAAGLPYPNASWTMDDLARAARALTEYDSTGAVSKAGLMDLGSYMPYLMRSLTGTGFYTDDPLAASPSFDQPALESLLTTWTQLQ